MPKKLWCIFTNLVGHYLHAKYQNNSKMFRSAVGLGNFKILNQRPWFSENRELFRKITELSEIDKAFSKNYWAFWNWPGFLETLLSFRKLTRLSRKMIQPLKMTRPFCETLKAADHLSSLKYFLKTLMRFCDFSSNFRFFPEIELKFSKTL